jgi:hypothetical protein
LEKSGVAAVITLPLVAIVIVGLRLRLRLQLQDAAIDRVNVVEVGKQAEDGMFFDIKNNRCAVSCLLSRSKFGFPASYTPPAKIFPDTTPRNVSRIDSAMALTR